MCSQDLNITTSPGAVIGSDGDIIQPRREIEECPMTPSQREILASIQALTLAGAEQTGLRFVHEVRADGHSRGRYFVSEIRAFSSPSTSPVPKLHLLTLVEQDGADRPTGLDENERTLAGQRDELAAFIARNRKQEAA